MIAFPLALVEIHSLHADPPYDHDFGNFFSMFSGQCVRSTCTFWRLRQHFVCPLRNVFRGSVGVAELFVGYYLSRAISLSNPHFNIHLFTRRCEK